VAVATCRFGERHETGHPLAAIEAAMTKGYLPQHHKWT
jgi:hypothetical protein